MEVEHEVVVLPVQPAQIALAHALGPARHQDHRHERAEVRDGRGRLLRARRGLHRRADHAATRRAGGAVAVAVVVGGEGAVDGALEAASQGGGGGRYGAGDSRGDCAGRCCCWCRRRRRCRLSARVLACVSMVVTRGSSARLIDQLNALVGALVGVDVTYCRVDDDLDSLAEIR